MKAWTLLLSAVAALGIGLTASHAEAQDNSRRAIRVSGDIDGRPFQFIIHDALDLTRQCVGFYNRNAIGSVASVRVTVNNRRSLELRAPSSWRGSQEVCGEISKVVMRTIPSDSPGRNQNLLVTGRMENQGFSFVVVDLHSLNVQCQNFYSERSLGSVDDITVAVNGGAEVILRNSASYWRDAVAACGQILQVVQRQVSVPVGTPGSRNLILITGEWESRGYSISARDVRDILVQCREQYQRLQPGAVDDVTISVNGSAEKKLRNSASYWRDAQSLCGLILREVLTVAPQFARGAFVLTGTFESTGFLFIAQDLQMLQAECQAFVQASGLTSVDDIRLAVNDQPEAILRNSASYWRGPTEICSQLLVHMARNGLR